MLSAWHFFSTFNNHVEITLTKTDLKTAHRYVCRLVPESLRHFLKTIKDGFDLTKPEILHLPGQADSLSSQPLLARTLDVRHAFLSQLHFLQGELLEHVRDREEAAGPLLRRVLLLTIKGNAADVRNTG